MKRTAILIAALAGALLAAHAQAQQPGQRGYLGIGYGSVWSNGGSFFSTTINEDTVAGGKIYAGYMTSEFLGLEVGLYNLGKYEVFLLGTKTDEFKTTAVSVAGVLAVPLGGGYYFNGRLGLAFTNVEYDCLQLCDSTFFDTKKRGTSGLLGIGFGARLAQSVEMRIDYDHFGGVHHAVGNTEYTESYDILSVNLVLLF